ncbi:hypothetical protein ACFODO_00310 [Acinetobacter sichuanensis]|uniref:Lipoprotein n=1 Tax=Acinetobacter sichuanensis TaxID=2136183 RepID=A0A371YN87_9GAMM|nr:hypothetical protein [Acinetobacter sichuanensis]RFC82930.1 hypothetical protein C9E89_013755 [Acinetobacter sichuanensis]
MKKLLQGAILPFFIFASGMTLLGCNQAAEPEQNADSSEQVSSKYDTEENQQKSSQEEAIIASETTKNNENLKSGNMFYIARDVANVQLKTGDYIAKLQQAQTDLETAIQQKDQTQLQETAKNLSRELQGFNTALISLDLKSQEIDQMRQQVLAANKQVLNSALLNGEVDFTKIDFDKIEKQMGTIQSEMIKLAGMMIPKGTSNNNEQNSE